MQLNNLIDILYSCAGMRVKYSSAWGKIYAVVAVYFIKIFYL